MKNIDGKIRVHPVLWKLHGKQAYLKDLVLTYLAAVAVAVFNLVNADEQSAGWMILLIVLSLDVGGGVISNFPRGTIDYYRGRGLSPHAFIWLHLIQCLVLAGLFQGVFWPILLVSGLTLTSASVVISLHATPYRPQISHFVFVILLLAVQAMPGMPVPAVVLLLLMCLKLVVAFAVCWQPSK